MEKLKYTHCAGGIVLNSKGEVLVVSQGGRTWSLPKGHIEPGETELDGARREIYEESGISELEFIKKIGDYQRRSGVDPLEFKTISVFLFKTAQNMLKSIDPENPEARWIEKDKVSDLLSYPKDKEFFLEVKNKI